MTGAGNVPWRDIEWGWDKPSFAEFMTLETQTNRLVAVAYHILGDWDEAEDVRSDTLIELERRWRYIDRPSAYGHRIAINLALRRLEQRERAKGTARMFKRDATFHSESAEHDYVQRDTLHGILAQLSERQAHVVVKLYYGWTVAAIAVDLDISESAVRRHRDRAVRKIQAVLGDFDITLPITEPYGEPA